MKLRTNKGFSLVEIILSVAVLSIISVFVIRLFVLSHDLNLRAQTLDQSVALAESTIQKMSKVGLEAYINDNAKDAVMVDGKATQYYTNQWHITNKENAKFVVRLEEVRKDNMIAYDVQVLEASEHEERVIYELKSKEYK